MNRWLMATTPLLIGHRGASRDAPENTLAAFRQALEQGADGIEFDVQPAADGKIVVFHDGTLNRTTSGMGRVSDYTAAELGRLDAGGGEKIPTLAEVFSTFGDGLLYNVELKKGGQGFEEAVAAEIARFNLAPFVTVSSFNPFMMRRAQRVMPAGTLLAQLRYTGLQRFSNWIFTGEADHPYHRLIDARYMTWARRRGLRVHTWTVDDPVEGRRLVDLGVHALITNTPGALRRALNL